MRKRGVVHIKYELILRNDLITFEDLNIKGMIKNHFFEKHIADVAWSKLITIKCLTRQNGLVNV